MRTGNNKDATLYCAVKNKQTPKGEVAWTVKKVIILASLGAL